MAREMLVPGAVALVRSPDGELSTTFGTTTFRGATPVSLADHVRIGSITKTWTGTVILQQAQEGKLSLDDPVSKFRPDVPGGDHMTIAELLNMRSGLYNYTETRELNEIGDNDPQKCGAQTNCSRWPIAIRRTSRPERAPLLEHQHGIARAYRREARR